MSEVVNIKKLGVVGLVSIAAEPSAKDKFTGVLEQTSELPATFNYGARRTLTHTCSNCEEEVAVKWEYGAKNLVGLGSLSSQDFNENRAQLDIIALLFNQYLVNYTNKSGSEVYIYINDADYNGGALLDVSYYYCTHCRAQYLAAYRIHTEEYRPPFDPDLILFDEILHVRFDEQGLLRVVGRSHPQLTT